MHFFGPSFEWDFAYFFAYLLELKKTHAHAKNLVQIIILTSEKKYCKKHFVHDEMEFARPPKERYLGLEKIWNNTRNTKGC